MAKSSGLGGNFYVNGFDLSGDVGMIQTVRDSGSLLDITAIDKSAYERLQGLGDSEISFTAFFNDATGQAFPALKARGATHVTYAKGTTLGDAEWSHVCKQATHDGARGNDGSLAFTVQTMGSDGNGLRAGRM